MNEKKADILLESVDRDYKVAKRAGIFRKENKTINALIDVSFKVNEGEIFGLVGSNGAGKTTLIKILATLLYPTRGRALVAGYDVVKEANEVRKIVNMVAGAERMLHYRLTGRENLQYYAELYNVPRSQVKPRIAELLEIIGMTDKADIPVERYSKGMKQRVQIARALINDPKILLLDEPTIGLDVEVAREIRSLIMSKVKENSLTVLLTSHYLFEIDEMVDRLAIIDNGRIIALDTPESLKSGMNLTQAVNIVVDPIKEAVIERIRSIKGVLSLNAGKAQIMGEKNSVQKLTITVEKEEIIPRLISELNNVTTIRQLSIDKSTLEDVFLKVINETRVMV